MWQFPSSFTGQPGQDASQMGMGWGGGGGGDSTAGAGDFKLGWNAPTMQMGMQGLNTLGNIWGAWQSSKLAKDQLNFTKMITRANLQNQMKAYNTALEDRSRSRAAAEGQSSAEAQAYVDRNRMTGK